MPGVISQTTTTSCDAPIVSSAEKAGQIERISHPVLARYVLTYIGGLTGWRLTRVVSGVMVTVGDSGPVNSMTNSWTIEDSGKIRVAIDENGSFSLSSVFTFQTSNESFINILN